MTQELLNKAVDLDNRISQCDNALKFMTHGTFHQHNNNGTTQLPLPLEVCLEMRSVIEKWKKDYETKLEQL